MVIWEGESLRREDGEWQERGSSDFIVTWRWMMFGEGNRRGERESERREGERRRREGFRGARGGRGVGGRQALQWEWSFDVGEGREGEERKRRRSRKRRGEARGKGGGGGSC